MKKSEITEENDEEEAVWLTGSQREKVRRIIEHQKSLYWSSSSPSSQSSSSASCSSFSSCQKSSSLLELMKGGSTSLRRLFDMEHTSLSTYFDKYSGSP
ncbi:ATP-dependent Clp protease proteolytic subunit like [Melia azedarach]|uniref:ATP-dependent Clp protease proteolytic subunit like n=1 Tax=Melia azedarach TaxID=155640 RepID=A0ACC1WZ99_MELAZ|nr:ATP-dependent Clp protease proteolytic subunit like [Melia azedarach]